MERFSLQNNSNMKTPLLLRNTFIFVTVAILYKGSAFKIFDAEPLLRGSPIYNMSNDELEEVLNLDPGGEYTTMGFNYEHDQYLGQYDKGNEIERCYNDHIRCLTTIVSASRSVCAVAITGKNTTGFGTLCDLYLDNCKRNTSFWSVIDSGNCTRAQKVYKYIYPSTTPKPVYNEQ